MMLDKLNLDVSKSAHIYFDSMNRGHMANESLSLTAMQEPTVDGGLMYG